MVNWWGDRVQGCDRKRAIAVGLALVVERIIERPGLVQVDIMYRIPDVVVLVKGES